MYGVGSSRTTSNSVRNRKEKRFTYLFNDADDTKHCAGVNCLSVLKYPGSEECDYLFTGGRDGTLKRWELAEKRANFSATFESHADWVNDAVLTGSDTLVSCSSDASIKVWSSLSDGTCMRTFRQHSDYINCLAAANSNSSVIVSGGCRGEVFVWDIEAALSPISKLVDADADECSTTVNGVQSSLSNSVIRHVSSSNSISLHTTQSQGYVPVAAQGHKESIYSLTIDDMGTTIVSGGIKNVVRVWDSRSGSQAMKLRGHTGNVKAILLDSTGRYCLSGASDSMIRLWDLTQQRCIHSYAVHVDSVWALASSKFNHAYSGGRDGSLYLTDLATRESVLLCKEEHPILKLALHNDSIWVATTDSSVHRWPAEAHNPLTLLQRGGSFLAGNLSFSRAQVSMEGSTPVPVHKEPSMCIAGTPAIVQHEILNNKRHVLTKDTAGVVKLWEITKGAVMINYGKVGLLWHPFLDTFSTLFQQVSFEEKKEELFEKISAPSWFTTDIKFGSLSVNLDMPQCFSAEINSADLFSISGKSEDDGVNLARETLKGLLVPWLAKRRQSVEAQTSVNREVAPSNNMSTGINTLSGIEGGDDLETDFDVYPPFHFSVYPAPSIITEGSKGGPWRRKATNLDGTEDEKGFPQWVLDCVLRNRLPPRENNKSSFDFWPCEDSRVQILTQENIGVPPILKTHEVIDYVPEASLIDKPVDNNSRRRWNFCSDYVWNYG